MKRFHVHVTVRDLAQSVAYYSRLFGQEPDKQRPDYARWMLADPRVNFAISSGSGRSGVDHLGFQAEDAEELLALRGRASAAAGGELLDEGTADCCYARGDKHWTIDPQGIAWEHYHTMDDIERYGGDLGPVGRACSAA